MDHRQVCKMQYCKSSKKEHKKNAGEFGFGSEFLDTVTGWKPQKAQERQHLPRTEGVSGGVQEAYEQPGD